MNQPTLAKLTEIRKALDEGIFSKLGKTLKSGAKKAFGRKASKNSPKAKALLKKLKKQKGVRDPEALAAWIGRRVGASKRKLKRKGAIKDMRRVDK